MIGSNGRVRRRAPSQALPRRRVKATGLWPQLGKTRAMEKMVVVSSICLEMIPPAMMGVLTLPKVITVSSSRRLLPLEFVWALAAACWDSLMRRAPVSTDVPAASACGHVTDLGYVVKAVSMMVSLPRLMTARASVIWEMSPPASWMDRRWIIFARHLPVLRLPPHKLWTLPMLRTRRHRLTRAVALMQPWL